MGKPEKTKNQILDAAASTLILKPGASLNDVAKAAGVGRATLHRYFPKREELIEELTRISLEDSIRITETIAGGQGSAKDKLRELIDALIPMANRYQYISYSWSMLDDQEIYKLYNQQQSSLADLMENLKSEGEVDVLMPTRWVVSVFDSLVYAAWLSLEYGEIARADATDLVFSTLLTGVSARNP